MLFKVLPPILLCMFFHVPLLISASPIRQVVTVMLENRPFDHLFGYYTPKKYKFNGLTGNEVRVLAYWVCAIVLTCILSSVQYNLKDTRDPTSEKVYVNKNAPYLNDCDPSHGTEATTLKIFGGAGGASNSTETMGATISLTIMIVWDILL